MEEKRKSPRVRANMVVSYKLKVRNFLGSTRIKDISASGVCIPSKHYFPVGSVLDLEITSPDLKETIKAVAHVVRVNNRSGKFQFELGLVFTEMIPEKFYLLEACIKDLIAQGKDQEVSWLD